MKKHVVNCSTKQEYTVDMTAEEIARNAEIEAELQANEVKRFNADIDRQLNEADIKIVRAIAEGNTKRIQEHVASQAALRAQKK